MLLETQSPPNWLHVEDKNLKKKNSLSTRNKSEQIYIHKFRLYLFVALWPLSKMERAFEVNTKCAKGNNTNTHTYSDGSIVYRYDSFSRKKYIFDDVYFDSIPSKTAVRY